MIEREAAFPAQPDAHRHVDDDADRAWSSWATRSAAT
jgi:hypothetical protein